MNSFIGSIIGSLIGSIISKGSLIGAIIGGYVGYLVQKKIYFRTIYHKASHQKPQASNYQENPYDVLGVKETDSLSKISAAYRELAKKYHPDILRASGLTDDKLDRANKNMARINAAWEEIKRRRNG
ncbi:MAG: DnaJ domain-containing protein [Kiritimatiellae bacterium]|nr:DnaJ domain-containing protein [Kiritimatiellia bacterium]